MRRSFGGGMSAWSMSAVNGALAGRCRLVKHRKETSFQTGDVISIHALRGLEPHHPLQCALMAPGC